MDNFENDLKKAAERIAKEDAMKAQLKTLHQEWISEEDIDAFPTSNNIWKWLLPTALVFMALTYFGVSFLTNQKQNKALFSKYMEDKNCDYAIASLKGLDKNRSILVEDLCSYYEAENYAKIVDAFDNIPTEQRVYDMNYIHLVIANLRINQPNQALDILAKIEPVVIEKNQEARLITVYFYQALGHLQSNNRAAAQLALESAVTILEERKSAGKAQHPSTQQINDLIKALKNN